MLGRLRERYERAFRPVGEALARLNMPPSLVTALGLAVACMSGYAFYLGMVYEAVALMAISGLADMLDGALARALGRASSFGELLDRVVDRYSEFAILLGAMAGGLVSWHWGVFALFGMVMASYARSTAEAVGGRGCCRGGIMERQEKLIAIALGALATKLHPLALEVAVIAVGVLSHVTAAQRLLYAHRGLQGP